MQAMRIWLRSARDITALPGTKASGSLPLPSESRQFDPGRVVTTFGVALVGTVGAGTEGGESAVVTEGTSMPLTPPDALLFITRNCKHCPAVLQGLNGLIEQGRIGKLTVVDAAEHPEQAEEYGVRAAPWLRLGPFTLTGEQSPAELRQWAEWASGEEGIVHYVEHM